LKKYFEKNTISLLLIGRDAELFVRSFETVSLLKITMCNSMKDAVSQAFKQAEKGDIILLSPACASYDMYQNYIERGDDFKHLVEEL
jgi:UDP-N-acetylmuramoylalanine--D-glutamate ligase